GLAALDGSAGGEHRVGSRQPDRHDYLITGTAYGSQPFQITGRYVIGADGAHSVVRSAIGQDFPGQTYPSQFVLADVALTSAPCADDEASITLSRSGVTVIGRRPSGNSRTAAPVAPGPEVPGAPDKPYLDDLLTTRGIHARLRDDPAWSSRFRVHHRVADHFRVGGVFLAGDAAHVHSPAAGQGMNTGIADAYDLATPPGAVRTGQAAAPAPAGSRRNRRPPALEC